MKKLLSVVLFIAMVLTLSVGLADDAKLRVEVELTYR